MDAEPTPAHGHDLAPSVRQCLYCYGRTETFARSHAGPHRVESSPRWTGICAPCWEHRTVLRPTAELWSEVEAHHVVSPRTDPAQFLSWLAESFRRFRDGRIDPADPARDKVAHDRFRMLVPAYPLSWMPIGQYGAVNPATRAWEPRLGDIDGLHRLTVARQLDVPALFVTQASDPRQARTARAAK